MDLLTVKQVAEKIDRSIGLVYIYINRGYFVPITKQPQIMISSEDVDKFLTSPPVKRYKPTQTLIEKFKKLPYDQQVKVYRAIKQLLDKP